jgi:hypothetical protein
MKLHKKLLVVTGTAFLLSSSTLFAAEQSAREILNKAYEYIGNMDTYAFKAVIIDNETQDDGTMIKERFDVSVKVDRPGKLRVDTKGTAKDRSSYINNGVYTMIDHGFGYYGQLKTPETIDGALDHIFENFGIKAPLAQLIYTDMDKRLKFIKSKSFGTMMVDGTECNYVAFSNLIKEVHVWIATGNEPLVKAYSIIDNTDENEYRINTSLHWDANAKISDSDFVFKAPKGAAKISVNSPN